MNGRSLRAALLRGCKCRDEKEKREEGKIRHTLSIKKEKRLIFFPARPFHNSRVSRSGDGRILCSSETSCETDFEAPELWKGRSGLWVKKRPSPFFISGGSTMHTIRTFLQRPNVSVIRFWCFRKWLLLVSVFACPEARYFVPFFLKSPKEAGKERGAIVSCWESFPCYFI